MFTTKDPNTYTRYGTLTNGGVTIGSIILEYQVNYYDDVQVSGFTTVKKSANRKYSVVCTQRINIYNPSGMILSPDTTLDSYSDYPAMVNAQIEMQQAAGITFGLLDYSPKTVNTQVQSSGTVGTTTGEAQASSTSNTIGSSTSQTNTYGTSVTVGDISGVSADYQHSTTVTNEHSSTTGSEISRSKGKDISSSASMTIKDWGAYSLVNPTTLSPSFTFGQEFPWDAIECRKTTGALNPDNSKQVQLVLPNSMLLQLYDNVSLYPPSQLSMFGINFVMKGNWLVVVSDNANGDVDIEHTINYFSASHLLDTSGGSTSVSVYIDKVPSTLDSDLDLTTTINLPLIALDALGIYGPTAITGFLPNKFTVMPATGTAGTAPVPFQIMSTSNDLMVRDTTTYPDTTAASDGAGFSASETSLTASFSPGCAELEMTIYFKVIDSVNDYTLYMKHWKNNATGVMLTFIINEDESNPIVNYVDNLEAEGGDDNLLAIVLRNQNYSSVYYYDYLQPGLNSVQIKIQPIGGAYVADSGYQVRAISIEKS